MMDTFDDKLDQAARELGERLPGIDASLDDRVMAAVRTRPRSASAPARARGLGWLLEPRSVQIRPIWIGALAAAAALALFLAPSRTTGDATPQVAALAPDTVYVHFSIAAPSAQDVSLAGSFNGWDAASLHLRRNTEGGWEATVALPVGEHRYQFVVDGRRWIPDPSAQSQVDDGFGGTNSVIVVGPKGVVRS